MKRFIPLRHLIIYTSLVFSLLMSVLLFVISLKTYEDEALAELTALLRYAGGTLAGNLEWALAAGDEQRVNYFVVQQVTRPHQQLVAYVDQNDIIRAATDMGLRGRAFTELPALPSAQLIERVRRRLAGEVFHDAEHQRLWAVFPVALPPAYREVRSERPGLALMIIDTAPIRAAAMERAVQFGLLLLLPYLILSLVFAIMAKRLLSDRIERLLAYSRSLVHGEALPPPVRGNDELGLLAAQLGELMQQLVASRDFHVLLLERMPNPIWRCDASGRRDYFNQAWLSFTGRSAGEEEGEGWLEGLDEEERQVYRSNFVIAFARRAPFTREYRLRAMDGSRHWIIEHGEPIFDAEGAFLGYLGSCFDRQREREATERVAASESRFRGLVERSMVGVYLIYDGRMQYANPRLAELFGYAPQDILGVPVSQLVVPADRALVGERLRQRLEGEISYLHYAFNAQRQDGSSFPVEVYGSRIVLDGRPAVIGSLLDVSERRRAEAALQESEARFRATFEQAAAGVAHMGLDGRWLHCNECMCRLFGYAEAELQTLGMADVTHPEDVAASLRLMNGALAGDFPSYTCEKRYLSKDGRVLWVNVSATLLRDAAGMPLYFIVVLEDMSARKEAEAALQQLNATLEASVEARTAELAAANKELETFAYSVSHDLKTPLRGIDGYSHILLEDYGDALDDTARAYLGNIRRGVATMGQLIDDLLAYSRMERRELRRAPVDMAALARHVLDERAEDVARLGAELRVELPAEAVVQADRDGLALVLRNLVDNALKYSRDARPPRVGLGVEVLPEVCRLWVRDNGIGFDMAYHDRIFEIFQRLERAERYSGTGVGLAMVRKAVQRMGGRVWAESVPGQGASFYVELPRS